jgi:hypothetical protein
MTHQEEFEKETGTIHQYIMSDEKLANYIKWLEAKLTAEREARKETAELHMIMDGWKYRESEAELKLKEAEEAINKHFNSANGSLIHCDCSCCEYRRKNPRESC